MEWETVIGLEIHAQLIQNLRFFQQRRLNMVRKQIHKLVR